MFRVHHALFDGQAGMKLFRDSMSDDPADRIIRAVWQPRGEKPGKKRARISQTQAQKLLARVGALSSDLVDMGTGLVKFGAGALQQKPGAGALIRVAPKTAFNVSASSSARRYANCEIPLDRVKAVATATGCTVNDVLMTVIDDALHHYLRETEQAPDKPLSVLMPLSFRSEEHGTEGNQVSMDVVTLGEPGADLTVRLKQVHEASQAVKSRNQVVPVALRQLYSVFLTGRATLLPDLSPLFNEIPVANLLISNMTGPREQLYLGGARLIAFHGLPIVPPGAGLNVTFSSVNRDICLGVGTLPEAMRNPFRLTQLIQATFEELSRLTVGGKPGAAKSTRKKKASKKTAARKRTRT
jgi:WS/DGAT/MGAT family acyltransferase